MFAVEGTPLIRNSLDTDLSSNTDQVFKKISKYTFWASQKAFERSRIAFRPVRKGVRTRFRERKRGWTLWERRLRAPYPHLLRSNVCPTDSEAEAIRLRIQYANERLEKIQKSLKSKDVSRYSIRTIHLSQLQHFIRSHQAILNPVRRLPTQVIQEIVIMALDMLRNRNHPMNRYSFDGSDTSPWRFAHVCRSWRRAALACPLLWASFRLFPNVYHSEPIRCAMLEQTMARTDGVPFHFLLYTKKSSTWTRRSIQKHPFLHTLYDNTSRKWGEGPYHLYGSHLEPFLNQPSQGTLHRIAICILQADGPAFPTVDLTSAAPHLIDVELATPLARLQYTHQDGTNAPWCQNETLLPWSQLERLAFYFPTPSTLGNLQSCSKLTKLTIVADARNTCPPLFLPSLLHLRLVLNASLDLTIQYLTMLAAPFLKTFVLMTEADYPRDLARKHHFTGGLVSFLSNSNEVVPPPEVASLPPQSPLTHFTLGMANYKPPIFAYECLYPWIIPFNPILALIPRLTHLDLTFIDLAREDLETLAEHPDFLPHLTHISLRLALNPATTPSLASRLQTICTSRSRPHDVPLLRNEEFGARESAATQSLFPLVSFTLGVPVKDSDEFGSVWAALEGRVIGAPSQMQRRLQSVRERLDVEAANMWTKVTLHSGDSSVNILSSTSQQKIEGIIGDLEKLVGLSDGESETSGGGAVEYPDIVMSGILTRIDSFAYAMDTPPETATGDYQDQFDSFKRRLGRVYSRLLDISLRTSEDVRWFAPSFFAKEWVFQYIVDDEDKKRTFLHRGTID